MKRFVRITAPVNASTELGSGDARKLINECSFPGDQEDARIFVQWVNDLIESESNMVEDLQSAFSQGNVLKPEIDGLSIEVSYQEAENSEGQAGSDVTIKTNFSDIKRQLIEAIDSFFEQQVNMIADEFDTNGVSVDTNFNKSDVADIYLFKK